MQAVDACVGARRYATFSGVAYSEFRLDANNFRYVETEFLARPFPSLKVSKSIISL